MDGAAQRPRANDSPFGESRLNGRLYRAGRPQTQRPERVKIILPLHRAEVANNVYHVIRLSAENVLVVQATMSDGLIGHRRSGSGDFGRQPEEIGVAGRGRY